MEFLSRYKNALVLITVVLVQAIALAVQVQRPKDVGDTTAADGKHTSVLRHGTLVLFTPFERVIHWTSFDVRHVWGNYIGLRHAHQENDALKQEVARLRIEQAAFAEDAAQGRRLQTLLQFKQHYISQTVAAQVIGTSGSDSSHVLTLDKGSKDGLKADMPVITPNGVVGKLRDVFPHTSQLLLLSDSTAGAGVVLESTRIRAILHGTTNGRTVITNLTSDSRIKPGEKVLTSGGDMVFPRGLPVGVVESIGPDPAHQPYTQIVVKPTADLQRLEEVLIVTGMQQQMTVSEQQDADAADAVAAENKRAADEVAEKLPSIQDDSKDADADENSRGGVQGVPNSGLPKTEQALRPDKYSPGAEPPADELKPGGTSSPQ
jgi:rod shape-determining protein MreC